LLLPINYKESKLRDAAEELYHDLVKQHVEVLLDDRDERPGVKFKDADLIGIPLRVTIGAKGLEKGIVELRRRRDGKTDEIPITDAVKQIKSIVSQSLQA
jgi:prolyl-tRNA synthetase